MTANSSANWSNESVVVEGTFANYEELLIAFGSTWFWDSFWLFVVPFVSIFGFLTNLLSAYIFYQDQFQTLKLYSFIRVVCLSSAVLSFFTIFDFVFYSRRFLDFVNTYWASAYDCFIHEPITNTAYFFSSLLEVVIVIDRLSTFTKRLCLVPERMTPWKIIAGAFGLCVLIDLPYYFVLTPSYQVFRIESTGEIVGVHSINESEFSMTLFGRVLTFGVYLIRDFLTMTCCIVLNVLAVVFLKRHLRRRRVVLNLRTDNSMSLNESFQSSLRSKQPVKSKQTNHMENRVDRKASLMAIVMCIDDIILHMITIIAIMYSNFNDDPTAQTLARVADFVLIFKNAVNFPIFYIFNKNFKTYFHEKFGIKGRFSLFTSSQT